MVSLTTAAKSTATEGSTAPPGSTTITPYSYATSKIVRTAVAAGIIVLALSALILTLKVRVPFLPLTTCSLRGYADSGQVTAWIRYNQRLRRQHYLTTVLESEQRANAYEIAAWADEPGLAPVRPDPSDRRGWGWKDKRNEKKRDKHRSKMQKRGGANAFAVKEWEGVAS